MILWLGAWYVLSTKKKMKQSTYYALTLLKQINMILFIFNMIPIPGFDGFTVFSNLYKLFF
jgi:Zn-dependent protease